MIISFGRATSPLAPCRAAWCRRALSASTRIEGPSRRPMPPRFDDKPRTRNSKDPNEIPPKLFVRPWDGVESMLDGFAMLRGIEKKYGKIKTFEFVRDGEIPSAYFSYFWVELEDPSRYSDSANTVLQIPVPEVERSRPGGVGIVDLQPFLRPSPEAQEKEYEWTGVTERMIDEVDKGKRTRKVYDLRIAPSYIPPTRFQIKDRHKHLQLTNAFVKWGGFASSPTLEPEAAGASSRPTLDLLIQRAPSFLKTAWGSGVEKGDAQSVEEEPHKPFNDDFDEPTHSTDILQAPSPSQADKAPSRKSQSLLGMQREGKQLSKKQKALLQAAAISRTPLSSYEEKVFTEGEEKEERESNDSEAGQGPGTEMDEERKRIHNKVWELVRTKWF